MPATRAATGAVDQNLPSVISDTSDKQFEWDGNPLTRPVWLSTIPAHLEDDKTIRDLFEKGWVLMSNGRVAVESAIHARYISLFPNVFFEWDNPAPPFSPANYELRRLKLMKDLDDWYANRSPGERPPYTLSFYDPAIPSVKPLSFIEERDKDTTTFDCKDLSEAEKLRFIISPESIAAADSAASVLISKTISDTDLANELARRY